LAQKFQKAETDLGKNMLKSKQLNICNSSLLLEPGPMHSKGEERRHVISVVHRRERILQKATQKNGILWTALEVVSFLTDNTGDAGR